MSVQNDHSAPGFASGFTLLELMIVIAIIAILALMAMPSQTVGTLMSNREQVLEGYAHIQKMQGAVAAYRSVTMECPDNEDERLEDLGIAAHTAYSGHYVNSVTVGGEADDDGGCTIVARYKENGTNAHLKQRSITVQLFGLEDGVPKWACFTDLELQGHMILPRECRFADADSARASQEPESG